jgi:competence protein ComEC
MQQRASGAIAEPAWVEAAWARLVAWREAERGRFVLWLPVLMTGGAAAFFTLRADPAWWLAPVLAGVAAAGLLAGWFSPIARAVAAAALAGALGFGAAQIATWRAPPPMAVPRRAVMVEGVVRAVEPLPEGRRVTLQEARLNGDTPARRLIRIRLRTTDATPIVAGDTLRVRALLMQPAAPAYPGAWDSQRDAFYQWIGAYGMALGDSQSVAAGEGSIVERLREGVAGRIGRVLSGSTAAIATTFLTGTTSAIPEADRRAFRDAGLAHLLAIAGLHVGIVMGLVFAATRLALAAWEWAALRWPTKPIAAVAALLAAAGYMLLTGAHMPVQRSFAMACLFTLGVVVGRRAISLRGLALAMAALVALEPHLVMGVSFQMSFSAVLALIVGFQTLRPWLLRLRGEGGWRGRLAHDLAALAVMAALAGTFSAPFAAYHFGQVQLYNVLANMAAVPLTAFLIMPAGLVALALMPLGAEAIALVPMGLGVDALLWIARGVSSWPAATVMVPHMPPWGLVLVGGGLAWAGLWRTRLRLAGWLLVALGLASPAFVRPPDLLVAADGRMLGLRDQNGMYVQTAGSTDRFAIEAWRVLWRTRVVQPIGCGRAPCPLQIRPDGPEALLVSDDPPRTACSAAIVLSLAPVRLSCPKGVPVIDRFSVWRAGAHAIWLDASGVRVLSDRTERGERVWMPRPTPPSRSPQGLVPAQAEDLPVE